MSTCMSIYICLYIYMCLQMSPPGLATQACKAMKLVQGGSDCQDLESKPCRKVHGSLIEVARARPGRGEVRIKDEVSGTDCYPQAFLGLHEALPARNRRSSLPKCSRELLHLSTDRCFRSIPFRLSSMNYRIHAQISFVSGVVLHLELLRATCFAGFPNFT